MLELTIRVISVVAIIGAIYFTYRITRMTGVFLAWSLFTIALLTRAADNFIELAQDFGWVVNGSIEFTEDTVLPLSLSIFLLLFVYQLTRTFERQMKRP